MSLLEDALEALRFVDEKCALYGTSDLAREKIRAVLRSAASEDDTPTLPEVTSTLPRPERTCTAAPDWEHVPDPGTFYVYDSPDGGVYLDVSCRYCGCSGTAGRFDLESKVEW